MNSSQQTDLIDEVELISPPGRAKLRLRFDGPFEGHMVHWNATLFTPAAWAAETGEQQPLQNIIEVGGEQEAEISLRVCLKVDQIDLPTVRKTVMMIRQYRRLSRGRHCYG